MGDPRLLRALAAGAALRHAGACSRCIADMRDTMVAAKGAGLAAPQIGVRLRVVIFGFEHNQRYPDAEPVPYTELVNPVLTPLSPRRGRRLGGLPVGARVCAAWCRASAACATADSIPQGRPHRARSRRVSTPASCSTNATISTGSCTRCACATCAIRLHRACFSRRGHRRTIDAGRGRRPQRRALTPYDGAPIPQRRSWS